MTQAVDAVPFLQAVRIAKLQIVMFIGAETINLELGQIGSIRKFLQGRFMPGTVAGDSDN
jgi:hypothetical protein